MEWNDATVQTGIPMPEIANYDTRLYTIPELVQVASYAFYIYRPSYFCVTTATLVVIYCIYCIQ